MTPPAKGQSGGGTSNPTALPAVSNLSLHDAALAYAQAGIPVFPLSPRTKRPIEMGGFTAATTDLDQIDLWWGQNPNANIGAVPGMIGCIVPDIDTTEGREAWAELVPVPTSSTLTGGGVGAHPWYRSTELAKRSHWRLDPDGAPFDDERLANLLFRASGGYVVVSPSIHPDTGNQYRLEAEGIPIADLPSKIERALLGLPARQAGGGHAADTESAQLWFEEVSKPETSEGGATVLSHVIERIAEAPKDARNDTLLAEVGVLLNAAYLWPIDLEDAREQIRAIYVPHVADTRKASQANREVDHAFDYVATQRHFEGPLEEGIGGLPLKPKLKVRSKEVSALAGSLVDLDAILDGDAPAIDWLARGIIPRYGLTAVVAQAKVGKSLFLLDMAASLACGAPFLGFSNPIARTLYVDFEMTPHDLAIRLQDMGYADDQASRMLVRQNLHYALTPPMPPLDTAEGGAMLLELAQELEVDLVIVDTLAAAVAGAENDSDTFRAARRHTWTPLKAAGIAVIRADHLGKDQTRGARGSSMKRDDVDVAWELVLYKGKNDLLLKLTHARPPGIEDQIEMKRHTVSGVLVHERVGGVAFSHSAILLADELLQLGIDTKAPRLRERLRAAGVSFANADLAKAREYIDLGRPLLGADLKVVPEAVDPEPQAEDEGESESRIPEKPEKPKKPKKKKLSAPTFDVT